jgi:hypothetical protein
MKLTPKERAFAAAYVKDPARNATQAAREAGYGTPRVEGPRAIKRVHVQAQVANLEAEARKRLKVKRPPKRVEVEVLPPSEAVLSHVETGQHAEQHAIASRAEVLGMCTNLVRAHESRKVGDLFVPVEGASAGGNMVMDATKVAELPLSMVGGLSHDHAGDLELKLRDPLAAGKILLDDHYREHGDEDPMAGPRQIVNILMLQGSNKDREAFDAMARRMADLGQNGGGDGDG